MTRRQALRRVSGALAVFALPSPVAFAQVGRPDTDGFIRVSPGDLHWTDAGGVQTMVVAGDPSKPGIYVIRNRFAPGQMSRPHFHNQDRYVTVIAGTWWTATGPGADVYDPSKTMPLATGGFLKHPAGAHHYDGAKDEPVIVQIIGMGPVTTTSVGGRRDDSDRP